MLEQETEKVEILGIEFNCQVCQHNEFRRREVQLNTAVATSLMLIGQTNPQFVWFVEIADMFTGLLRNDR